MPSCKLDLRYDRKSDGEFVHFYTRTVGSVFFEFVERRGHYDGYGTAAASRGAAGGSAQRSLRRQQDLDRPPFVHGAVAFGDVVERQRHVEYLAGLDLSVIHQIDEVRQKSPHRCRTAAQTDV